MNFMDRKGQSLVLFVLLLPIMIGMLAIVIDVGKMLYEKEHMDSVSEMVLEVALDGNMNLTEVKDLLRYNLEECDVEVIYNNGEYIVKSRTQVEGIFSKLFGFSGFTIYSESNGRIQDGKSYIIKQK